MLTWNSASLTACSASRTRSVEKVRYENIRQIDETVRLPLNAASNHYLPVTFRTSANEQGRAAFLEAVKTAWGKYQACDSLVAANVVEAFAASCTDELMALRTRSSA
ncbi:hypothetical protein NKJ73_19565 [Mesorhizobium sp. M0074]|uniref:hypothetical protein n=1 Tax=Mesorhizobium sp. M0074 TaxID=2956869 RepID=UPI0033394DA8